MILCQELCTKILLLLIFQAAQTDKAASDSPSAIKFPGEGQVVGRAEKNVLPLPIPNGIFFPPPTSSVCSTLSSATTTVAVSSPLLVISYLTLPRQTTTTATLAVTSSLPFQKMLFGMPATIHAKNWLSIKSRGDLKTTWIGLAHSLIHFFCKALF